MNVQFNIIDVLAGLLKTKNIISVSGVSGTGKTTIALYFIGNYLTSSPTLSESCIWIQASERFPKKRLERLFKNQPEKLTYLNQNIFIIPGKKVCANYHEQSSLLTNILSGRILTPPNLRVIVIDNISHHLRYIISYKNDKKQVLSTLNEFFSSQLLPLIFFCQRAHVILILIHESSFDIKSNINKPFFFKLYERIDSISIVLEKELGHSNKLMNITTDHYNNVISYQILDHSILMLD